MRARAAIGRKSHLDGDAVARHIVGEHRSVDDGSRREHALELAAHNLLAIGLLARAALSLALAARLLVVLVANLGAKGRLALVDTADLVALREELGGPHVEARLWHANHLHLDPVRQLEVELAVADGLRRSSKGRQSQRRGSLKQAG